MSQPLMRKSYRHDEAVAPYVDFYKGRNTSLCFPPVQYNHSWKGAFGALSTRC